MDIGDTRGKADFESAAYSLQKSESKAALNLMTFRSPIDLKQKLKKIKQRLELSEKKVKLMKKILKEETYRYQR